MIAGLWFWRKSVNEDAKKSRIRVRATQLVCHLMARTHVMLLSMNHSPLCWPNVVMHDNVQDARSLRKTETIGPGDRFVYVLITSKPP